jgi:hypothetical protein
MPNFDADCLRDLRDVQEVVIRTEKHRNSAVVIWVVVADEEVFVRSWLGTRGRWYKDIAAGGPATLEFVGQRLEQIALDWKRGAFPERVDLLANEGLERVQSC